MKYLLQQVAVIVAFTLGTVNAEPPREFSERLKSGGQGPMMVVIPAGSFKMGDLSGGGERVEQPQHTVHIGQAFAMSKYEVTFAEYELYAKETNRRWPDDKGWGRETRPVLSVSWNEAQGYVKWLSEQTSKTYRLPSESEWEYAARAGRKTPYFWGASPSGQYANGEDNRQNGWPSDGFKRTAPVGSFKPNGFGLYDVSGNVWEWVEDCWHENYKDAPNTGSAWIGGGDCQFRTLRGGSWSTLAKDLRSASRYYSYPADNLYAVGFRVVQELP